MTMPRNLALSPTSILIAIHDTVPPPASDVGDRPGASGQAGTVQGRYGTEGRQTKRRDMVRQKIQVERVQRLGPDQPLGNRTRHPVMQTLADHRERQSV